MENRVSIFGLWGLIFTGRLYTKQKYYVPKFLLDNLNADVKQFTDDHAIKNGDLIFQTSL